MTNPMTLLTKSNSVRNSEPQLRKLRKGFFMVCLNPAFCFSTVPANVFVSLKYFLSPLPILLTIPNFYPEWGCSSFPYIAPASFFRTRGTIRRTGVHFITTIRAFFRRVFSTLPVPMMFSRTSRFSNTRFCDFILGRFRMTLAKERVIFPRFTTRSRTIFLSFSDVKFTTAITISFINYRHIIIITNLKCFVKSYSTILCLQ